MDICLFLLSNEQFGRFSLYGYPIIRVIRSSDQAVIFLRDDRLRVLRDSPVNVTSVGSPNERLLVLERFEVDFQRFQGFVRFIRPGFDVRQIAATQVSSLSVLSESVHGLIVLRTSGTKEQSVAQVVFHQPFMIVSYVQFHYQSFNVGVQSVRIIRPTTASLAAFSRSRVSEVSNVSKAGTIRRCVLGRSTVGHLSHCDQARHIRCDVISGLCILRTADQDHARLSATYA